MLLLAVEKPGVLLETALLVMAIVWVGPLLVLFLRFFLCLPSNKLC